MAGSGAPPGLIAPKSFLEGDNSGGGAAAEQEDPEPFLEFYRMCERGDAREGCLPQRTE